MMMQLCACEQVWTRRTQIIELLRQFSGGATACAIAGHLGYSPSAASRMLRKMMGEGHIVRTFYKTPQGRVITYWELAT